MASLMRSKKGAFDKTRSTTSRNSRVVEQLDPPSGWTEDPTNHYLLINLPNFKKEEIKIEPEGPNKIKVSGERRVKENKFVFFEKTLNVPENADNHKASEKLEEDLLTVTIPKRPVVIKEADDNLPELSTYVYEAEPRDNINPLKPELEEREEKSSEAKKEEETCGASNNNLFSRGIEIIIKNKVVIFAAIVAFSLGVFSARKFSSGRV